MTSISRKRILVFVDWYLPGFKGGGPIQSIVGLCKKVDAEFYIVTSIFDHDSTDPYSLEQEVWIKGENGEHIYYVDPKNLKRNKIKFLIKERDYHRFYINSLFSFSFALLPLLQLWLLRRNKKTVLAPRGMLKAGALSIKADKKKRFIQFSSRSPFFKKLKWHATNEQEAAEIKQHYGNHQSIAVAPNLSPKDVSEKVPIEKHPEQLRLITIARVAPEKNILAGINYLQSLKDKNIRWEIYGTLENSRYLEECRAALNDSDNISVNFMGEINPDLVSDRIQKAHFFYLPTLGENYGHAIVESFACGRPVIISKKTPWQNLEKYSAGFDLDQDKLVFSQIIDRALKMEQNEYDRWSEGAMKYGYSILHNKETIEAYSKLFEL